MGDKLKNYGIVDKLNIKIIQNIINPALSHYFNEMLDKNMFLDYYNRQQRCHSVRTGTQATTRPLKLLNLNASSNI